MSTVQYKKCDICGREEDEAKELVAWFECAGTYRGHTRKMDICSACIQREEVRAFQEVMFPFIAESRIRAEKLDAVFGKTHRFVPTIGIHGAFESLADGSIVTYPEAVRRVGAS